MPREHEVGSDRSTNRTPDSENPRGFARDILECCGGPGEPTDCTAYWSAVCCGPCRTAQLAAHVLKWRFLPSISFLAATLTLGLLLYIPFNPTFPVLPYFQFKEVLYLAGFTFLISLWILTCCIIGAVRNRIREAEGMANQNCSGGLGDEDYMAACCCTACAAAQLLRHLGLDHHSVCIDPRAAGLPRWPTVERSRVKLDLTVTKTDERLGITLSDASSPERRARRIRVVAVGDRSVVQLAGVRVGDIILTVNGVKPPSVAEAIALLVSAEVGAAVPLTIERMVVTSHAVAAVPTGIPVRTVAAVGAAAPEADEVDLEAGNIVVGARVEPAAVELPVAEPAAVGAPA